MQSIIKKFKVLVGIVSIIAFFAFAANASAAVQVEYLNQDAAHQYPNDAVAPLTVRVTYYVDPNGDPYNNQQLTSYRWSCDGNGANQTQSTTFSVECYYGAPGSYDIRLEAAGPSGPYSGDLGVSALAPTDVHQPIRYIGPVTLYRSTVWGVQSPKPIVNAGGDAGQGGFFVDTAKCPASMPAGTRCFRLGKNSPAGRSVLIDGEASTPGSDENYDKVTQRVQVLPDPVKVTASRYRVKRRGSCTYGGKINVRTGVPATAVVDVSLQMRLSGKKWTVMGHQRTTKRYNPSVSNTKAQVRFGLMRGPVVSAARRRGARFRFVYQGRVADGTLKYYDSRRRTVGLSPSQVLSCGL